MNMADVESILNTFRSASSYSSDFDKASLRKVAHSLAEYCNKEEYVEEIVRLGAIETVVPVLKMFEGRRGDRLDTAASQLQDDVKKECCHILGLLAVQPGHQNRIATSGALGCIVKLLEQHRLTSTTKTQAGSGGVARRAADAITNLAHENVEIKNMVREQGGIPPLVALLEAMDAKVQRAACGALRTLAFKNDGNKHVIVDGGALPMLVQLLRSEDPGVHYEAVGVIGNLVHSSQTVKRKVLEEGALQPVINLLNSECSESKRESALLLGQFATVDSDTKAHIVQRGAVAPLIRMLALRVDSNLREMAAFALGRLTQNPHNQAGVVQNGGLVPLLESLESKHYNLQHNAAFALYGIAESEDNIPDMIKEGALQRLEDCCENLQVQASKDCVQKTISRMEQKLRSDAAAGRRALNHVIFLLRSNQTLSRLRAAIALARFAPENQIREIFVERRGVNVLLDVVVDPNAPPRMQRDCTTALLRLLEKLDASSPVDEEPQQPGRSGERSVYLGPQYVNSPTLSDVTFLVEGRRFHAHRIALLDASEAFRVMFDGVYKEKDMNCIKIPNISYEVFEAMMTFVYTGTVELGPDRGDVAFQLLQVSDQYFLTGLKRLCEMAMAQQLSLDNVSDTFHNSETFNAPQLAKRCFIFILQNFEEARSLCGADDVFFGFMQRMVFSLKRNVFEQEDATMVFSPTFLPPTMSMSGASPGATTSAAGDGVSVSVDPLASGRSSGRRRGGGGSGSGSGEESSGQEQGRGSLFSAPPGGSSECVRTFEPCPPSGPSRRRESKRDTHPTPAPPPII